MDENEITQRLRDAGTQPVPGEVRSTHLTRMHAAVPVVERQKRFGRLAVAAAAFVGFAVGSTGFAMAGALPERAQQVAHDVLSIVQVDVDDPKQNRGQCISEAARTNADEADKQAAKAECPKGGGPDGAGKGRPDHAGKPGGPNGPPHAGDPCKGPPPWAGKGAKDASPEDKRPFQETRAACPDDGGADDPAEAEREAGEDAAEAERETAEDAAEAEAEREADEDADGPQGPPAGAGPAPQGQGAPPDQAPAGQPELPAPLDPGAGAETPSS